ncbi:MAG TPA: PAS domain S-box protein [Ignavibacteria bacterium]|nr:PAS domain S-box protein [Ignavibacteria bacterium]HMQ98193.1 PAS domain S-box protein [Ignavibacteria bacterium]
MSKSILNKQSLIFLFILGIAVLASVSLLTYMNLQDQNSDHDFIQQTFQRADLMDNIYSIVNESETSRRGYFLTGDKQFVSDINNNRITADSLLKQLRANSLDNANQLANAELLKPMVTERFALFNDGIEIQDSKGTNMKFHKNIFDKGKILNIDIKNLLNKMKKEEFRSLEKKKELTETSSQFTFYTFLAGVFASILIFTVAFVSLIKKASHTFAIENQEISREELEQIVKERTAEISQINQKLYSKVSELEKMEGNLKSAAEQYRKLFEQAHDAIVIFSPEDHKVIEVNRRACDLYGFSRDEFIGLSLKNIWKNIPQDEDNIKHTVEKGYYHNFQSVHSRKDMNEMLMEINASVFNYRGKNVILSINRDITDRILKVPV